MAVARDYVSLLKLRIVLLLDATAVGVMIPAAHGHPRVGAVLAAGELARRHIAEEGPGLVAFRAGRTTAEAAKDLVGRNSVSRSQLR